MFLEDKTVLENIKKASKESLIASLLLIIFAIVLLMNPENFMNTAINVFGYVAIFMGVLNIVFFFRIPKEQRIISKNFESGIMLIVFGIIAFIETVILKEMVTILIGGYLIYRNANKAGMAMKLQSYSAKMWIYLLIISLVNILLGFFIVINPFTALVKINTFIAIIIIISEVFITIQNIILLVGLKKHEPKEEK